VLLMAVRSGLGNALTRDTAINDSGR
jgi:hypothetical protein